MGLAGSVFVAGRENRVAFGVIDQNAGFLYGKTALYVARDPNSPAKGPYVAPADVLVTDAPYRSQQAATEADPFAAVYAAQVPFDKPGSYSVLAVTLVDGKPVAAPEPAQGDHGGEGPGPRGRRAGAEGADRHGRVRGRRRRGDRHAPPDERHARRLRRGRRQEAGRAAVRDAAAVPVARLRPGRRRRAAAARALRRPGGVHPPGGLHRQRPEQGPAQAAAASSTCRPSRGCSSSARTGRSRRGSRARSASTRSSRR